MKVLLAHNFYRSSAPSGEDEVYRNESALLKARGHEVVFYERRNDDIRGALGLLRSPLSVVWSEGTYRELRGLIRRERPDVAHFHNIWYLISPSAYYACAAEGVPVVQTMHNFRAFCVNGLLLRGGRTCEDCLGRIPWRGALRGCFRDSMLHSLPVALTDAVHGYVGTWPGKVSRYIALTSFSGDVLKKGGLPAGKVSVKPNFLKDPPDASYGGKYAVYIGRLSGEKGVHVLIKAMGLLEKTGARLKIIGDGPLRDELKGLASEKGACNIEFLGARTHGETIEMLKGAAFTVVPSLWYEMFPMAVIEAYACGKAVVASRIGSLEGLVRDNSTGLLFNPGDPEDLSLKMKRLLEDKDFAEGLGRNARRVFEENYTEERNYGILMDIYNSALKGRG